MTTSPLDSSGRDRASYRNRSPPDSAHITSSGRNGDGGSLHSRGSRYTYYSSESRRQASNTNAYYNSSKFRSDGQHTGRHLSGGGGPSRYGGYSTRQHASENSRSRTYDNDPRNGYSYHSPGGHHDNFIDRSSRASSRSRCDSWDSFEGSREVYRDGSEERNLYSRRNDRQSSTAPQRSSNLRPSSSRSRVISFDQSTERRRENETAGGHIWSSKNQSVLCDRDSSTSMTRRMSDGINADSCLDSSPSPHDCPDKSSILLPSTEERCNIDCANPSNLVPSSSSLSLVSKENMHQNPTTVDSRDERIFDVPVSPTAGMASSAVGNDVLEVRNEVPIGNDDATRSSRACLGNRNRRNPRIVHAEVAYTEQTNLPRGKFRHPIIPMF